MSSVSLYAQLDQELKSVEITREGISSVDEDKAAIKKRLMAKKRREFKVDSLMKAEMKKAGKQSGEGDWSFMYYTVEDGDTIFIGTLPTVYKFHRSRYYTSNKQWRQYRKLVYNFKRAYPYALEARRVIHEADSVLATGEFSEIERERYLSDYQKRLFAQFEKPMRDLTFSQGRLLLKLIDRELGRTSFYIIREYRGRLSAGFWQTVARLFGNDLKKPYDRFGEDRQVEDLVQLYNSGAFEALYYSMYTR